MLSLSRCPSKKRRKKKSSSSLINKSSTVASKNKSNNNNALASVNNNNLNDDDDNDNDNYDHTISRSRARGSRSSSSLKENNEKQQVVAGHKNNNNNNNMLLKQQRERQKRRKMKMESAFASILQPSVQQQKHSEAASSELRRMERMFWNDDDDNDDDDDSDKDENENENGGDNNVSTGGHYYSSIKSKKKDAPAVADRAATLFAPSISDNGAIIINRTTAGERPSSVNNKRSRPSSISTNLLFSLEISDDGEESASSHTDPLLLQAPPIKSCGKKRARHGEIRPTGIQSEHNDDAAVLSTNHKDPTTTTSSSSSVSSTADPDLPLLSEKKNNDTPNNNDKVGLSKHKQSNNLTAVEMDPSKASGDVPDNKTVAKIPHQQSDRTVHHHAQVVLLPFSCGIVEMQSADALHQPEIAREAQINNTDLPNKALTKTIIEPKNIIAATASSSISAPTLDELDHSLCNKEKTSETSEVQASTTRGGPSEPKPNPKTVVSKSKASSSKHTPLSKKKSTTKSNNATTKAVPIIRQEKVASDTDERSILIFENSKTKVPPHTGLSKTAQELPATGCIEGDHHDDDDDDPDDKKVASKVPTQRGGKKKRGGRGLCALCTTCPCRRRRKSCCDDDDMATGKTTTTLGLVNFARSDAAMEKALIRRLKKVEKSAENLQDQQEMIKRKLKKHRRDILRKKIMKKVAVSSSEDKETSYFLPDAEELDYSESNNKPFKVADDWVAYAQKKMFPSALEDNQQSLTQLGFLSSKSKKSVNDPAQAAEVPIAELQESAAVDNAEIAMMSQSSTRGNDKIENEEDSVAPIRSQELTTEEENQTPAGSGFEKAHRISWRNGLKLSSAVDSNNLIATSALEGLLVPSEETVQDDDDDDDANSVLSLIQDEERPMGSTEPCPWDNLFADCVMGDEICDLDQLLKLIGSPPKSSPRSTQESSKTLSIHGVSNSVASQLDLSQGGKEAAEGLIAKISSDEAKIEAINQVCPNWKENVSFAFGQSKEDIQKALHNLQESQRRLEHTKQMIMEAWYRNRMTMSVFQEALEKSLDR